MPSIYPDTIAYGGYETPQRSIQEQLLMASAKYQTNVVHPVKPRTFVISYPFLSETDQATLRDFFDANAADEFYLFDFRARVYSTLVVGTGTGAATVFTLPGKETAGATFSVSGTPSSPQPSLSPGTGAFGEDQITFTVAPADLAPITMAATGFRLRHLCKFDPPSYRDIWVEAQIVGLSWSLVESP